MLVLLWSKRQTTTPVSISSPRPCPGKSSHTGEASEIGYMVQGIRNDFRRDFISRGLPQPAVSLLVWQVGQVTKIGVSAKWIASPVSFHHHVAHSP